MSTYEPGTVAIATVRGVSNVRVMRRHIANGLDDWAFETTGRGVEYSCTSSEAEVADIRPLVVLDLGPGGIPAAEAVRLLRTGDSNAGYETLLDWLADQIEAQTKPPRIPEPGLWGVVEASTRGNPTERHCYGHTSELTWVRQSSATGWCWEELVDPTLVRDGIEATS